MEASSAMEAKVDMVPNQTRRKPNTTPPGSPLISMPSGLYHDVRYGILDHT